MDDQIVAPDAVETAETTAQPELSDEQKKAEAKRLDDERKEKNRYYNDLTRRMQTYLVQHDVPVPRWRDTEDVKRERKANASAEDAGAKLSREMLSFNASILLGMSELRMDVAEEQRQQVTAEISERIVGLGVLQPFLQEDDIEEIIVRNGFVTTERNGQLRPEGPLAEDDYFYRLARRIAEMEGIGLGGKEPKIKVGLPDGSRFAATIPPLSRQGTAINIRRFSTKRPSMVQLKDWGSADQETIDFLEAVASSMRHSVVFAGRPGAGKTTWLNAFSKHLPQNCQVTVVETFAELAPQVPRFHHLVVEDEEGEMGEAINTSVLRMRPDVLMIGEVVSREAYQYIMALNLGIVSHTTTHAQSAYMGLKRLENLARRDMTPAELRPVIGNGLSFVVHLTKEYDPKQDRYVRYLNEIVEIKGYDGTEYEYRTIKKCLDPSKGEYSPLPGDIKI